MTIEPLYVIFMKLLPCFLIYTLTNLTHFNNVLEIHTLLNELGDNFYG